MSKHDCILTGAFVCILFWPHIIDRTALYFEKRKGGSPQPCMKRAPGQQERRG